MTLAFKTLPLRTYGLRPSQLSAFTFPGGEAHIKGGDDYDESNVKYELADLRGADSHELMQLAMWAESMPTDIPRVLILPYLPGARADKGTPTGASVYAIFLNNLIVNQIITLDPHSPFMPDRLNVLTVFPVERIIARELGDRGDSRGHPYVGVIAPDAGAHARAAAAARVLGVPVYTAGKTRNQETGELTGFTCEPLPGAGKLLVVDDICDGGGTFIGLAKATGLPADRLDLWVTHGIFSKGVSTLLYYFDEIHMTDSYPTPFWTTDHPRVTVHSVTPYLTGEINV